MIIRAPKTKEPIELIITRDDKTKIVSKISYYSQDLNNILKNFYEFAKKENIENNPETYDMLTSLVLESFSKDKGFKLEDFEISFGQISSIYASRILPREFFNPKPYLDPRGVINLLIIPKGNLREQVRVLNKYELSLNGDFSKEVELCEDDYQQFSFNEYITDSPLSDNLHIQLKNDKVVITAQTLRNERSEQLTNNLLGIIKNEINNTLGGEKVYKKLLTIGDKVNSKITEQQKYTELKDNLTKAFNKTSITNGFEDITGGCYTIKFQFELTEIPQIIKTINSKTLNEKINSTYQKSQEY